MRPADSCWHYGSGRCVDNCGYCEDFDPVKVQGLYQCNNPESHHYRNVFTDDYCCCDDVELVLA